MGKFSSSRELCVEQTGLGWALVAAGGCWCLHVPRRVCDRLPVWLWPAGMPCIYVPSEESKASRDAA